MEYFYGGGGRSNPDFCYRFLVESIPPEMYRWCTEYPLTGPFERWYIQHNGKPSRGFDDAAQIPMVQIENRNAAYMFRLAFSEYILEDVTYDFVKGDNW